MYKRVSIILRTILFLFGVSVVMVVAPRPVLAEVVTILQIRGNGTITPGPPPHSFPGNVAQFDKTLSDLNTFDMQIGVTGIFKESTIIILDEKVFNNTPFAWQDYHFTLGTGGFGGLPFVESTEVDVLFFLTDGANAPVNIGGNFDKPIFDEPTDPDRLAFLAGVGVGVPPGTFTRFRVAINVPNGFAGNPESTAIFTLRQQATIPEPTTLLLLGTGLAGFAMKARKRLKKRN